MDKSKPPGIFVNAIVLSEFSFRRDDVVNKPHFNDEINLKYGFSLPQEDIEKKGRSTAKLTIDLMRYELIDEGKRSEKPFAQASVTYSGIFSIDQDNQNMEISEFLRSSAPAIIFPFCREKIASAFLEASLPNALIQPINISAILRNSKENSSQGASAPAKES